MEPPSYEIQELVELSGVARRNIYFYVQQGLLPPPSGAGLAARYGEEHLLRLALIPLLRQQGQRLDQIRVRLANLSMAELSGLREQLRQPSAPTRPAGQPPSIPAGQACLCYDLPGGIVLLVPAGLNPQYQPLLERLLASASIA